MSRKGLKDNPPHNWVRKKLSKATKSVPCPAQSLSNVFTQTLAKNSLLNLIWDSIPIWPTNGLITEEKSLKRSKNTVSGKWKMILRMQKFSKSRSAKNQNLIEKICAIKSISEYILLNDLISSHWNFHNKFIIPPWYCTFFSSIYLYQTPRFVIQLNFAISSRNCTLLRCQKNTSDK